MGRANTSSQLMSYTRASRSRWGDNSSELWPVNSPDVRLNGAAHVYCTTPVRGLMAWRSSSCKTRARLQHSETVDQWWSRLHASLNAGKTPSLQTLTVNLFRSAYTIVSSQPHFRNTCERKIIIVIIIGLHRNTTYMYVEPCIIWGTDPPWEGATFLAGEEGASHCTV